jgi:hypothetical protein
MKYSTCKGFKAAMYLLAVSSRLGIGNFGKEFWYLKVSPSVGSSWNRKVICLKKKKRE